MKDIKLRDIMDITEKIKSGVEDGIQKISVAERILPSEPTLPSGPMHGKMVQCEGHIDNKEMCLPDICDRIASKASIGLSEEIDQYFMVVVRNRTIGRFTAREAMANLYFKLASRGEISCENAEKLREYANTIPYVGTLEREKGSVQSGNYVVLMQTLTERGIPDKGYFLVNSFIAGETLDLDPLTYGEASLRPTPPIDLTVHGCPVIIPRKNEIVGDEMYLFADKQYLGEVKRGELWLQIGISPNGISWHASVSYDFDIKANAIAVSTPKDENDNN